MEQPSQPCRPDRQRNAGGIAEQRGCQVYRAAADELGQELPLQPLLDALRARESDDPAAAVVSIVVAGFPRAADR